MNGNECMLNKMVHLKLNGKPGIVHGTIYGVTWIHFSTTLKLLETVLFSPVVRCFSLFAFGSFHFSRCFICWCMCRCTMKILCTFCSVVIPTFNQFFHIRWPCTCASLVSLQILSHEQPTFNEEIFLYAQAWRTEWERTSTSFSTWKSDGAIIKFKEVKKIGRNYNNISQLKKKINEINTNLDFVHNSIKEDSNKLGTIQFQ